MAVEYTLGFLEDYIFVFVVSYLIGSIPFSLIITKIVTGNDLRTIGSGNLGGRNVYRATKSLYWALLSGFMDLSRSILAFVIPFLLIYQYGVNFIDIEQNSFLLTLAGIGAVLGHNWPIWLKSAGGKGITVVLAVLVFCNPLLILFWIILWFILIIIIGYSSITYIVDTFLLGIVAFFWPYTMPWNPMLPLELMLLLMGISLVMFSRQGENFRKIRSGEAKKINLIQAIRGKKKLSEELLH